MAGFAPEVRNPSLLASTFEELLISPLLLVLISFLLVCLVTRVRTGIQNKQQSLSKAEPKETAVFPYWLPWLGHTIQCVTRFQTFLAETSKSTKDGVFHLVLAGTVHNVVTVPSVTKQVFLQSSTTITSNDFTYRVGEKVFGNKGSLRSADPAMMFGKLHHILFQLNREPFVSDAAAMTVKMVQERTYNLVSFSPSWVDQSIWERVADVSIDPSGTFAEASLFPLIRYFVGDFASGILMGQDFMTNNPNILPDLFTFDASFQNLLAGFPRWFPGMAPGYQARSRVVQAVREHQEALFAIWEDRDPGSGWNDMSDVSSVMQNRVRAWHDLHVDPDLYSTCDTILLWAMNVNANQIIFWLLWYIYQRPGLRAQLMQEIGPFVQLAPVESDLPIKEPPKLTIDLRGLVHSCPLFKASFYETLRLEASVTTFKAVTETFHVTESAEDAALVGKSQPQTYKFNKGSYICIPIGLHSMDGRYWKDPETFNPRRFFVRDEKDPAKMNVDLGTLKVWGGGATMCKGRNFAEREVLICVAAVLTGWDVEPVGGEWKDPGRLGGSGATIPKRDVRVRLRRREV